MLRVILNKSVTIALACGALLLLAIPDARAAPDREQCTCNIRANGGGSNVKNARACVQHKVTGPEWCNVYVHTLRNSNAHGLVLTLVTEATKHLDGNGLEILDDLLRQMLDGFINSLEAEEKLQHANAQAGVKNAIAADRVALRACLLRFASGAPESQRGKYLNCRVTESSKWLNIEMLIGDATYIFQIAPASS